MNMYIWYIFLYVLSVSSPYLLVFGDDRVCGTREQVMMQVELVRLSYGEGLIMVIFMFMFLVTLFLTYDVKAHGLFD